MATASHPKQSSSDDHSAFSKQEASRKNPGGPSSSTRNAVVGRLKPRRKHGCRNRMPSGHAHSVSLPSLPDELVQHIFELLHASYQREKRGVPPIAALLISKRITAIASPIWIRVLAMPHSSLTRDRDAYLAWILSRSDTCVRTQELDLSIDLLHYRVAIAVTMRLSALRKLVVNYSPAQLLPPELFTALAGLIEQLPALVDLDLRNIDASLARVISDISKQRNFTLRSTWDAFGPARVWALGRQVVYGFARPCCLDWTSAQVIELSTDSFDTDAASAIVDDLEDAVQQEAPLPLQILKLDIDSYVHSRADQVALMHWFCRSIFEDLETAHLVSLELSTRFPFAQSRLPLMHSVKKLRIGKHYDLCHECNFARTSNVLASFPNLQAVELDNLQYHASAASPIVQKTHGDRFAKLLDSTETERIATFPFLAALVALLVPTNVCRIHIVGSYMPTRQLRYTRAISGATRVFEAEAWKVEWVGR